LLAYAGLVSYCLTDLSNHAEREPFGMHRALWVIFIVFVPYVGAIFWLVARTRGRRSGGTRALGPDDDPDYLRYLRDQKRNQRRNKGEQ
jgi:hypothetical protein